MSDIINPFGEKIVRVETDFCGRKLTMETGRLAFQAQGSALVRYGDTVVLGVAGVADPVQGMDYFPLMVDYEEKMYAAGKISGSRFIKREGRPSDDAVQTSRLIDRPIRPLFPKDYRHEVQGIAYVLSLDPEIKPDIVAMIAVSAAINMADTPFEGPIAGVRIGLVDGKLVAYPKTGDLQESKLDLVVAGTAEAVMMVEAGADEVDEKTMVEALELAHESMQPAIELQNELNKKLAVSKSKVESKEVDPEVVKAVDKFMRGKLKGQLKAQSKAEMDELMNKWRDQMFEELLDADDQESAQDKDAYAEYYDQLLKKEVRRAILEDGSRVDGRKPTEIRNLSSEVGILPNTHGSAIFTRGATQAMNITTLAPLSYAQMIDTMENEAEKTYFHHYNFPGFTTGEVRRPRSAGRREIGHGLLAERALQPVIPKPEDFPYTIRTVSELMSSNGSTSMAAVCSSTLSLMDAGVPIKKPVSGIAMGLMSDGKDNNVILSDIQGLEDFSGDMDFKVAGTKDGITALQMDIKVKGLSTELLSKALEQAREGRMHILEHMLSVLPESRAELPANAPRVETIHINPEKVRDVIGKGGETINKIIAETGAEIDIRDGGIVMIAAKDKAAIDKAKEWVQDLTEEPEIGKTYVGTVVKLMDFGAFVQILPGTDGLVHISELAEGRVNKTSDVVNEGDKVRVKLVAIDDKGRINLSMKDADK